MNEIIAGRMKEGKSTFGLYRCLQHSPGVAAWDPRGMIDGIVCYGADALEDAIDSGKWKDGPLIYRFDSDDISGEFTAFCSVIFPPRFTLRKFSVLIDEAKQLQGPNYIHPSLSRAVTQHPRDVKILQTTHSLQDWARASKDLVTDIWSFRQIGRSLKALIEFCDGDEKMAKVVSNLPRHHLIHWDAASGKYSVLDDPSKWYLPNVKQDGDEEPGDEVEEIERETNIRRLM